LDYVTREIRTGKYPQTAALFGGMALHEAEAQVVGSDEDEERFERGLQALLDGTEARMAARRARPGRKR
jgi:hypothetical protein